MNVAPFANTAIIHVINCYENDPRNKLPGMKLDQDAIMSMTRQYFTLFNSRTPEEYDEIIAKEGTMTQMRFPGREGKTLFSTLFDNSKDNLLENLTNIMTQCNMNCNIFFMFSGHGSNAVNIVNMLCDDGQIINLGEILTIIKNKNSSIFCYLDCCRVDGDLEIDAEHQVLNITNQKCLIMTSAWRNSYGISNVIRGSEMIREMIGKLPLRDSVEFSDLCTMTEQVAWALMSKALSTFTYYRWGQELQRTFPKPPKVFSGEELDKMCKKFPRIYVNTFMKREIVDNESYQFLKKIIDELSCSQSSHMDPAMLYRQTSTTIMDQTPIPERKRLKKRVRQSVDGTGNVEEENLMGGFKKVILINYSNLKYV